MEKIFALIKEANNDTLWMFCRDVHELILEKYFTTYWEDNNEKFVESGAKSIEMIVNANSCKDIIDVGCGYNHFKDKFPDAKFTSIDPYIEGADYKMSVAEYQYNFPERQYDCVLALGSINFGPKPKILEEIDAVDKLTKPGGIQIWRVNPKEKEVHPNFEISELIQYFQWDESFIETIADMYEYELLEYKDEIVSNGTKRIFFIMKKSL